jgi:conflict system pore-forming effector with SLATT domain
MTELSPIVYPPLHDKASRQSAGGQRAYIVSVGLALFISLATALFLDVAEILERQQLATETEVRVLTGVSGVLLAIALGIQLWNRRSRDRRWFDGRAIAESVKTLSWKYMMRTPPFHDDDADTQLTSVLSRVVGPGRGTSGVDDRSSAQDLAATKEMGLVRGAGLPERRAVYVKHRLEDQIGWYSRKSAGSGRAASAYFVLGVVVQALAILLLIRRAFGLEIGFASFLTTLAASFIAWSEAKRYHELAISYAVAAEELRQIRTQQRVEGTESAFASLVLDAEGAISREHTMWIAKAPALSRVAAIETEDRG